MPRDRGGQVWLTLAIIDTAVEIYAVSQERKQNPNIIVPSLSRTLRRVGRTDTPFGRAAFAIGWVGFTAWFLPHILRKDASCCSL